MKNIVLVCLLGFLLTSCAHSVHQYGVSEYSPKIKRSTKRIVVEKEQQVVFYFADNTDYVDQAYDELQRKCSGEISGINTRFSTSLGFFSWKNKIHIEAYCL